MALLGNIDLNDLTIFIAVAETGGFTTAASKLDIATAKVSIVISRLEAKLGITLFSRTTRKVTLTSVGLELYEQSRPLLQNLSEVIERVTSGQNKLVGTLRISTTVDHATLSLVPALAKFSRQHPDIRIDLRTSEHVVDLIDDAIDISIRLGWLRDSSNRAAKLGTFDQFVVASPEYFKDRRLPSEPKELESLNWIELSLLPTPLTWKFTSTNEETRIIHVKSQNSADSPSILRSMLQEGMGVSVLDQFNAKDAIESRQLIQLLPEWILPSAGIYAVYPPGKQVSGKIRSFIDFYRQYLETKNQV